MQTNRFNTEVLIIGAGPTGLMMACQLLRFGIRFRIIDKQKDRAHESRAFAIQAKSMEILQNLGLADEFLRIARVGIDFAFFINGKKQVTAKFKEFPHQTTPFPSVYFLPQTETERILLSFLEHQNVHVEKEKELIFFAQNNESVEVQIKDRLTEKIEEICCTYLIGCDGAHSTTRHILHLPFEGAVYKQSFILADATIDWPFSRDQFLFFLGKAGIFLHIPLTKTFSRVMLAQRSTPATQEKLPPPTITEIEAAARGITKTTVKLINPIWLSQFHLHHRGVKSYAQGRAFLAGDAAHIHSPVGGQGMNTGIQDATNLAWKLALVLRKMAVTELLATYETERHRIGKILLKTSDRFFSFMTAKNFLIFHLRNSLLPFILRFFFSKKNLEHHFFWFISQLNIHYHPNEFVYEIVNKADPTFKNGPKAGYRAPDAPVNSSSLFTLLRTKAIHLLLFQDEKTPTAKWLASVKILEDTYADWVKIHYLIPSLANKKLFLRYGVTSSAIYLIRPDGYIGFRCYHCDLSLVDTYLKRLFKSK
jgi:2-polyprenyl-6-methoxyphenol hydroxylase-like FAD-dependent oxidoreductase